MPARGVQKRQRPAARVGAAGRLMPSGPAGSYCLEKSLPASLAFARSAASTKVIFEGSAMRRIAALTSLTVSFSMATSMSFEKDQSRPDSMKLIQLPASVPSWARFTARYSIRPRLASASSCSVMPSLTARASSSRRLASACLTFCGATIAPTDQWPRLPKRGSVMPLPAP